MRIVVLDGHTSNPGDLSWAPLEALGELTVHARTGAQQLVERVAGAEALLTNKVAITAEVLAAAPDCRYVGVLATGVNVVDLAACAERGITVCNVPAYSTASVAQATFSLLLELVNNVGGHSQACHRGDWNTADDFMFTLTPQVELAGLTLGLIGFGAIAQAVARIGQAFGMEVIANRRRAGTSEQGVALVSREELIARSDVISLHCPLTPETDGLVDEDFLVAMKPGAMLINTGRGALVDEAAAAAALHEGRLGGLGTDVLTAEPPRDGSPLLGAPRCVITPHIAWATRAARGRLLDVVTANLSAFIDGRPQNVVG